VKTPLLSALLLLTLVLVGGVLVLVHDVHQDLAGVHVVLTQTSATEIDLRHTLAIITAKVSTGADTLNAAATEERTNWKATSSEAALTGRALRLLISRVDRSFVDGTLQHVNTQTLPLIDVQVAQNGAQMAAMLKKVGETADGLTVVAGTLNTRLGDPQVAQLLGHFNVISGNLEVISANSAAMSGDMKLAVHRLTAPPTKFHQFLDVAWTTAKFGSLFVP
jgi:hypothetical protein